MFLSSMLIMFRFGTRTLRGLATAVKNRGQTSYFWLTISGEEDEMSEWIFRATYSRTQPCTYDGRQSAVSEISDRMAKKFTGKDSSLSTDWRQNIKRDVELLDLIHPTSTWTYWATLRRHSCLLRATTSASSQVSPIPRRSFLTIPLQFVLGRPGPLLNKHIEWDT